MKSALQQKRLENQAGFSLLELIVSMAIVSLISTALFQSMVSWTRLASRASDAADQSLSNIAGQEMFDRAVSGFVFAWPEDEEGTFSGSPTSFSGLSHKPLETITPQLALIQFSIDQTSAGGRLTYKHGPVKWALTTFTGNNASFAYLGADGVWRPSWPPAENPEAGPFDDAQYFATPQFPAAIKVTFPTNGNIETWIADISNNLLIPNRPQDLEQ